MKIRKIYSKKNKNKVIHMVYRLESSKRSRVNISPENQFLQVANINLDKNNTFKAHKHVWKKPSYKKKIAQESWVVIKGLVQVYFYDTDGTFLTKTILKQGDLSISFEGGHNYKSLKNKTQVYEFKTGPYEGIKLDKVFI